MTYEIRHEAEAEYHLLQFAGPPSLLESLDHSLRIADEVLRFRIIKVLPGTPPPPDNPPAARRRRLRAGRHARRAACERGERGETERVGGPLSDRGCPHVGGSARGPTERVICDESVEVCDGTVPTPQRFCPFSAENGDCRLMRA